MLFAAPGAFILAYSRTTTCIVGYHSNVWSLVLACVALEVLVTIGWFICWKMWSCFDRPVRTQFLYFVLVLPGILSTLLTCGWIGMVSCLGSSMWIDDGGVLHSECYVHSYALWTWARVLGMVGITIWCAILLAFGVAALSAICICCACCWNGLYSGEVKRDFEQLTSVEDRGEHA